jgi:hypothetical protein
MDLVLVIIGPFPEAIGEVRRSDPRRLLIDPRHFVPISAAARRDCDENVEAGPAIPMTALIGAPAAASL